MSDTDRKQDEGIERPLADRLRTTLHAARGNMKIRQRLEEIVADPSRFDPIVRELGPRHALVRDLLALSRRVEPETSKSAGW